MVKQLAKQYSGQNYRAASDSILRHQWWWRRHHNAVQIARWVGHKPRQLSVREPRHEAEHAHSWWRSRFLTDYRRALQEWKRNSYVL